MKKILLSTLVLLTAALLTTSCKKDSVDTFTGTAQQLVSSTKTDLASSDNVHWVNGDLISINGVTFTATANSSDATKASFSTTSTPPDDESYTAYYPASYYDGDNGIFTLPVIQYYNPNHPLSNVPMYAESNTTDLPFRNICAVFELNISASGKTVQNIIVSGTDGDYLSGPLTINNNAATCTSGFQLVNLYCNTPVDVTSTQKFYFALPTGNHQLTFRIYFTDGTYATKTMSSTRSLAANTIYYAGWTLTNSDCQTIDPTFGGITFSPTILLWGSGSDINNCTFATSQVDIPGVLEEGEDYSEIFKQPGTPYFDWTDVCNGTEEHNTQRFNINSKSWRVPTHPEWYYILFDRPTTSGYHWAFVLIGCDPENREMGIYRGDGMLIIPDHFDVTTAPYIEYWDDETVECQYNLITAEQWSVLEAAGCIFLPSLGYVEDGEAPWNVGIEGLYWNSTSLRNNLDYFDGGGMGIGANEFEYSDCVRLILAN